MKRTWNDLSNDQTFMVSVLYQKIYPEEVMHRISDSLLFGECFSVVCTVRAVDRYLLKYEFSQNYLRFISSCLPHETLADFSLMNPTTPKKTSFDVDFGRVISLAICYRGFGYDGI